MATESPHVTEAGLDEILEYCNTLRQAPIPADDALPEGFTGTIGHFPVYFPEEIAHSAGLLPVGILGGGNKLELKHADAHMGSFICSICRSTTEMGLNGALANLSGFVTHPICDAAKHLGGIWARNFPEQLAQILYLPQNANTPGAVRYVAAEYQRLRAEMEKKAGRTADDESLRASIRAYNRNRRLLRELYAIRRDEPWKLSCTESYLLLRARTRISCEEHTALLESAIAGIRARNRQAQDKPRVVFVGGFCEQPPLEMLEAIDDNCYVVDDDLLIGLRWLTEDVPETGDPVWALAESFIERSAASPVQHDERKSKEGYLMDMIASSKADAAIVTAAKFCEPGLDEQVAWSKHLDQVGVQYLVLEFEEKMTSFEQMAMQLETFAESLLFATA
ncbi:MAG: 2-hydroxyacyl-CoA dehydratase [Burkholderiales bacterium]|nr:2-hydroxyacyl-CoA dehydratase [Burkholderiaceae bacterium]MCZ2415413.1 2-hydroxyacyl-CoA dehydratase [Burkholderiales bacterium]MEB2335721.1 2-hydroxyacyl-CoA dehydratase [Burkholderiales bacterium]